LEIGEKKLHQVTGIRLYDGDDKTSYSGGVVTLTSHRLTWQDASNPTVKMSLLLSCVSGTERHAGGLARSAKVECRLSNVTPGKKPGPFSRSSHNSVKFAFKNHGDNEFHLQLNKALQRQQWVPKYQKKSPNLKHPELESLNIRASGISGIRNKIEAKNKKNESDISDAFQDLKNLMGKAKEMVDLSNSIAAKIKEKNGEITDDETIKFKSHLLSLGIANPVTKETHGDGSHFHTRVAKEVCGLLGSVVTKEGMMLLSDAYVRVNRARGTELLSPDDLLQSCKVMRAADLPLSLREFESGVLVLQSRAHSDDVIIEMTNEKVSSSESLSAQQLANMLNVSVLLAKEHLLLTEKTGSICRDDSSEGLRFYPNLLLSKA